MAQLNIFDSDAFSTVSMTQAIQRLPVIPGRIGQMGLFRFVPITTTTAVIEDRGGRLMLVPSAARGTFPNVFGGPVRKERPFRPAWIPLNGAVYADDVQNVRAFGQENVLETVSGRVNEKLAEMRQAIEMTHEWLRAGALKGIVVDGDGTTVLYNFFTEFGITQPVIAFAFDDTQQVKAKARSVLRWIEDQLGGTVFDHVHALCGDEFFDALIDDATVEQAFAEGDPFFSVQQARLRGARTEGVFTFGGVVWENYRAKVGSTYFVEPDEAIFFPVGVSGLFDEIFSPAPFEETVNTPGQRVYAKQKAKDWDVGRELMVCSAPLMMATRPAALVKGIIAPSGGTIQSFTPEQKVAFERKQQARMQAWNRPEVPAEEKIQELRRKHGHTLALIRDYNGNVGLVDNGDEAYNVHYDVEQDRAYNIETQEEITPDMLTDVALRKINKLRRQAEAQQDNIKRVEAQRAGYKMAREAQREQQEAGEQFTGGSLDSDRYEQGYPGEGSVDTGADTGDAEPQE